MDLVGELSVMANLRFNPNYSCLNYVRIIKCLLTVLKFTSAKQLFNLIIVQSKLTMKYDWISSHLVLYIKTTAHRLTASQLHVFVTAFFWALNILWQTKTVS